MEQFKDVFSANNAHYNNFTMRDLSSSCKKVIQRLYADSEDVACKMDADDTLLLNGKYFVSFVDIWNYSSGKYEEISENDTTKVILSPDPKHIPISQFLQSSLTSHKYDELLDSIKNQYPQLPPVQNNPRVHFGPIACGVAVVASQEIVQQQVKAHGRKTIGLDMESYGVCYAAQTTITKETPVIIVKSISDLANVEKDDSAQPYAAYTSAKFAENLIRNILT